MPQIYVIYRQEDTPKKSQEVLTALIKTYGASNIKSPNYQGYVDVYEIEQQVQKTDFLLVVIGNYWADIIDESGRNLLRDVYDPVHMAIATAIKSRKRIIPILVDGARMPRPKQLPRELRPMASQDPIRLDKSTSISKSLNKGLKDIIKKGSVLKMPEFVKDMKLPQRPSTRTQPRLRRDTQARDWQYWLARGVLPTTALIVILLVMIMMYLPNNVEAPVIVAETEPQTPVVATLAPTSIATIQNTPIVYPRISVDNAHQLTQISNIIRDIVPIETFIQTKDETLFIFLSTDLQEVQVVDFATSTVLTTLPLAPENPRAIGLSENETLLYILLGNGQVTSWSVQPED